MDYSRRDAFVGSKHVTKQEGGDIGVVEVGCVRGGRREVFVRGFKFSFLLTAKKGWC